MSGVSSPVYGSGGGSGTSIPSSIVGVWGEMIGSSTDAITPDTTTRKKLVYIKLIRTAIGDGDLMGDGAGGVPLAIANDTVTLTVGSATATVNVVDFTAVGSAIILVVEVATDDTDTTMRIGQLIEVSTGVFPYALPFILQ